jgi:hypothetical protein
MKSKTEETKVLPTVEETIDTLASQCERVEWSELYKAGKHLGQATAAMIRGDVNIKKETRLDGQTNDAEKLPYIVIYNREFVVAQIATNYRFVLTDCTLEEWLEVSTEAFEKMNGSLDIKIVEPQPEIKPAKATRGKVKSCL